MGRHDHSRVILIVIAAVGAVLVGVAVVVALQPPVVLDPTTPEGAAQGYFQALHDGDDDLVLSHLTDDLVSLCHMPEFFEDFGRYGYPDPADVALVSTVIEEDKAVVHVRISVAYGEGPFRGGSDTFDETLVMTHKDDRWLISEPAWPWDRYMCEGVG
jgi:hypothetical protein